MPLSNPDYNWEKLHEDLEADRVIGVHGGCNTCWHALAEIKANEDLNKYHKRRSKDEFYVESLDKHLQNPRTRARWNDIVTIDPLGMYAAHPTMSATTACMEIAELKNTLTKDLVVVNEDSSINCVKCAVDYVWNLPGMASRLNFDEMQMRQTLQKYTQNPNVMNTEYKAYLPPIGGCTVYFIGDLSKLSDPKTEVAVRVHDSCCGSDVFGTDICTCRPYLVFAIQGAVECAQRGGVGVIIYFQKEGRSLGEVTKFRVYNARKGQAGGDRPEMYFAQTESIAGIRDARFQDLMPDIILWLGIHRIDWLLSMSSEKYDAIIKAGITVMQRIELPADLVPRGATVEISAKIASGYHSATLSSQEILTHLRRLETIRERCGQVFELAKAGETKHFRLDLSKLEGTADYVVAEMKANYPDVKTIPYHSRWRHFDDAQIAEMCGKWRCDKIERARRLLDLATISVLLDAGAGPQWRYTDIRNNTFVRSEGLARASFDMFTAGLFSSDTAQPHRVNSHGLRSLTLSDFSHGLQVSNANPMVGVAGRFNVIRRLAEALELHPEFFGHEVPRPGNIVDFVLSKAKDGKISVAEMWQCVIQGFEHIWPEHMSQVRKGDVWVYNPLKNAAEPCSDLIPFHKLSQWCFLSLMEPIEELGIKFVDTELLTGLAEYRNGGLLVDAGVITPTDPLSYELPYDIGSELVVEWRALTICLMDLLADRVRDKFGLSKDDLPLYKVLQGGTWTAGRSIARSKRADGSSPITIRSDGTVF